MEAIWTRVVYLLNMVIELFLTVWSYTGERSKILPESGFPYKAETVSNSDRKHIFFKTFEYNVSQEVYAV